MTIKQKQCLLAYLGYYTGSIDGLWGDQSRAATEAFQRDYQISVDGVFGGGTAKRILEVIASGEQPIAVPEDKLDSADEAGTFWDGIKYFTRGEFRCPCGKCGGFPAEPKEKLVRALVRIREHFNAPITIVPLPPADPHSGGSGVRCAAYNATLSGSVSNSRHLEGKAADITVRGFSGSAVKDYCDGLVNSGVLRFCYVIGGGNSVHVDIQ